MEEIPLSWQFATLGALLICSGFFSIAETAMMACNRYRLRHLAAQGHRGARLALALLAQTDKLLGVILLGNNLINAGAATLVSVITIELFGDEKWALGAGTLIITFLILVFSEITPKVIGAAHADRIAVVLAYLLWPMLRVAYPVVWFINLFDLEHVTAADVMTPRGEIEAIDLAAPIEDIKTQLSTSYHTRVVAYEAEPGNVVGILHQRRLLADAFAGDINESVLRAHLTEPYYVPAATPIYTQLQFFQESRQRFGLVVDEYGEIQGLITLEDIIEELVGKFTTRQADMGTPLVWDADGTVLVDGATTLRDLNRLLELDFSLEGPRTLNGLVIEHLQDIPEVGVGIRINGVPMEIVQTQDRKVKMLRLHRPASMDRCAD